jgi:NADPH:quinone reductase-like Zn-dependent oxidoreductase
MCTEYKVLGEYLDGTHAEYLTIPWNYVLPKPRTLSWEETAAFPLAFLTAYHMLVKKVQLKPSDWILIWGASSGIGSAAVQIAKLYDCKIIATVSSQAKMDFATQLGVDYTINYIVEDVSKRIKEITNNTGVNVIFEHVGQDSWPHSLRALAKGGKIITCGATTGPKVSIDLRHLFLKHQQIIGSTMGNRQDLKEIKNLMDDGKIKPIVYRSLPFNEIKKAHQLLEQNQQQGKIVISFDI